VQLTYRRLALQLAHPWTIARTLGKVPREKQQTAHVVVAELTDGHGVCGLGEAAPSPRYGESVESVAAFLGRVDAARLSFDDVDGSWRYLEGLGPGEAAARCALDIALHDGAARRAGRPLYDHLGLGFREGHHVTSFSIGLDAPEVIRRKVGLAAAFPILKVKLGSPKDREIMAAVREVAPTKRVRVDANEAWKTREEALRHLEWLAADGQVEFVEQPMPAGTARADLAWLKARAPLPLMADESCLTPEAAAQCAEGFHAVNVKLVKTAGVRGALATLRAARRAGLRTMLGCMVETSILISAAAHLAELTDYLDLDGNLLITNDPYCGVAAERGVLSFVGAAERSGLRVGRRV